MKHLDDPQLVGPLVRAGDRVSLRRHVPAQRETFVEWYQDPEIAVLLRHDLRPLTPVQARGYFESVVLPASARNTCWAIHVNEGDRLIGSTAITDIDPIQHTCKFRIVIGDKASWSHGYGTEATRLVVQEAFEHLGVQAVRLEVFTHNERAQRAYLRVGFRETGRHREWVARARRELHVIEMEIRANQLPPG